MTKKDDAESPRKKLARQVLAEPGSADHDVAEAARILGEAYGAEMARKALAVGQAVLDITRDLRDIAGFPVDVAHTLPAEGSHIPERLGLAQETAQVRLEDRGDTVEIDPTKIGYYKIKS